MADKKKMKHRKVEEETPTKEEYAVAKYLRFNLAPREGKLHGMEVQCFIGSAAVDKLLDSKWSASKKAKEPLFTSRVSCVAYMLRLLEKGIFHRAEREKRKKDKDDKDKGKKKKKKEEKEESTAAEEEVRERKGKTDKKDKKEVEAAEEDADKKVEKKDEKKKKRLRLVMPDQQFFEDSDEVYVWIYDPVNAKNFIIGLLMVLGAIALCLFPLWPSEVRIGVYYLSLSAAGFVGFILSLVVVRLILFCCIWILTVGRHHFWFLPNLTEDVGFFDSFKPLYKHDYVPHGNDAKAVEDSKGKKKKGKNVDKSSSAKKEKSSDKDDSDEFEVIKKEDLENGADEDKDLDEREDTNDEGNEAEETGADEDDDLDDNVENNDDESNEENNDDSDAGDKKKTN